MICVLIAHSEYHRLPHPAHDNKVLPADELHVDVLRGLLPPSASSKHI